MPRRDEKRTTDDSAADKSFAAHTPIASSSSDRPRERGKKLVAEDDKQVGGPVMSSSSTPSTTIQPAKARGGDRREESEVRPKVELARRLPESRTKSAPSGKNSSDSDPTAVYFVYFIHCKRASGDRETGETMFKIGATNNVRDTREQFEQGRDTDLKTHKIIKCMRGDASKLADTIHKRLESKAVVRGWFRVSKEQADALVEEIVKDGGDHYECVSEARASKVVRPPKTA